MKTIINIIVLIFPWAIKRVILNKFYHYKISPNAKIGFSYIFPKRLIMEEGATIGHFNVAIHLDLIHIGKKASISRSNWITGFPTGTSSKHFKHQTDRKSELIIGNESAITKNHHIDCTNSIHIGNFVTIAGYQSQFLTHSINITEGKQSSSPIFIGDYSFISTRVILLGGSKIPAYSVLAAGSVLTKHYHEEYILYGGVPARPIKKLSHNAAYFTRLEGFIF